MAISERINKEEQNIIGCMTWSLAKLNIDKTFHLNEIEISFNTISRTRLNP